MTSINGIDLDLVIVELGELSRAQILKYTLLCTIIMISCNHDMSYLFTTAQVDYRCLIAECESESDPIKYWPAWLQNAVPFGDNQEPAKCLRYKFNEVDDDHIVDGGATTTPTTTDYEYCAIESAFNRSMVLRCGEFVYKPGGEHTIVKEFNITCEENEWYLTSIGSLLSIAEIMSHPICAFFSDKYGRRPVLIVTIFLGGVLGVIKSLSTSYIMYASMEFITALATGGTYMTIFVMAIEYAGPSQRVFGGALISAIYSSSQVLGGVYAMFFHNFRTLLQVLFVPHFLVFTFIWLVPESTRWLLTKGKLAQARKIILRASKMNGVTLSDTTMSSLYISKDTNMIQSKEIQETEVEHTSATNSTIKFVFESERRNPFMLAIKSKSLILRLINCLFCWFTNSFIYYGLNIHSVALAGNKYTNYIFVNLVEVPAVFVAYYLMDKHGRNKTLCSCLLLSGISCVVSEFVADDAHAARLSLYIIGKFGVTISFTILYVYSSELFPTYVRHSFMNVCSTFGALGSMIAPQTPLLVHYWSAFPLLLFGGSAVLSGLFVLLLPETLNTKLPDTVEEAEKIGKTDLVISA